MPPRRQLAGRSALGADQRRVGPVARQQHGYGDGVVVGLRDRAGARLDQAGGALGGGCHHRPLGEHAHRDRQRLALGGRGAEDDDVAAGQQLGGLGAGRRHEVGGVAERGGAGAQVGLGVALADHQQVHGAAGLSGEPHRGVDRHLVALADVEAGQAPDQERVIGDPEPAPVRGAGVGQRPEALRVDRVRHDADAPGRHARRDQRLTGALRDGEHRLDAPCRAPVQPAGRPAAHRRRHRPPLGPGQARAQLRRQPRRQQLLLLEVQEKDVEGRLALQLAAQAAAQQRPLERQPRPAAGAELGAEVDVASGHARALRRVGVARQEDRLVAARGHGVQQPHGGVLGAAARARGHHGDDPHAASRRASASMECSLSANARPAAPTAAPRSGSSAASRAAAKPSAPSPSR